MRDRLRQREADTIRREGNNNEETEKQDEGDTRGANRARDKEQ